MSSSLDETRAAEADERFRLTLIFSGLPWTACDSLTGEAAARAVREVLLSPGVKYLERLSDKPLRAAFWALCGDFFGDSLGVSDSR